MCFDLNPTKRVCRCCGEDANPVRGISKPADQCLACFVGRAKKARENKVLDHIASDAHAHIEDESGHPVGEEKPLAIVGPGGEFTKEIWG